jgi:hypothetical protein
LAERRPRSLVREIADQDEQRFPTRSGVAFVTVSFEHDSDYQGPRFAVDEFKISRTNEKIKNKMTLAKMLPFTNGPNEEPALTRALLG